MGKPFIKVRLHSGLGGEPLGGKNLVVYYECDPSIRNITDSDIISYDDELLDWVNTCGRFLKGDSNEDYDFDSHNTLELVYLDDDQIKRIHEAGHVFRKNDVE